ncbi:tetratricopeptide repeat protein, partial [Novosphingobium beihaiensis]
MVTRFASTLALLALFGLFFANEPAYAKNNSRTVSLYTYRTVTTQLIDKNEHLSNLATAEHRRALDADMRWQQAERELASARRSSNTAQGQVRKLEREAQARETAFAEAVDDLNQRLAAQDEDFKRMLHAALTDGESLLQTEDGRQALKLIALGGVDNTERAIVLLARQRAIAERVSDMRLTEQTLRPEARTILRLRGASPSATTIYAIALFEEIVRRDPSRHWDWVELGRLYFDAGRLADARHAADQSLAKAANERDRSVAFNELGDVQVAQGDSAAALA